MPVVVLTLLRDVSRLRGSRSQADLPIAQPVFHGPLFRGTAETASEPELTSLGERLRAMLVVRIAIAATVVLEALLFPREIGLRLAVVVPITVVYLLLSALTDAVSSAQFDLMFDATLGDDAMRAFLMSANRQAACHMAGVFEEAERRGFWQSRRNSSARILASVVEEAA